MGMKERKRIKCSLVTNLSTATDMNYTGGREHDCVSKTQRKSIFTTRKVPYSQPKVHSASNMMHIPITFF